MRKIIKKKCKQCKKSFEDFEKRKNDFCCIECKTNFHKENYKSYRGPSFEYVCRMLTTKNKTGDAYGITIPRELVDKYKLLGKKFKIDIKKKGVFLIKTKIEYEEKK